MVWWLSEKRRDLIRLYTSALCSREWPLPRRRYLLYLILRPALGKLNRALIESGLEPDEAESEIFILVSNLLSSYDAGKCCFLYHIEKTLPSKAKCLLDSAKRGLPIAPPNEESYEMEGEVYLAVPGILFENRWLARDLSQHEKNLILKMLTMDRPGPRALANSCQVGKSTIERDLQILAGKLKGRL